MDKTPYKYLYQEKLIKPDFPLTVIFPDQSQETYYFHSEILLNFDYFDARFNFENSQKQPLNENLEPSPKRVKRENRLEIPNQAFPFLEGNLSLVKEAWEGYIIPYFYLGKESTHLITANILLNKTTQNIQTFLSTIVLSDYLVLSDYHQDLIKKLYVDFNAFRLLELERDLNIVVYRNSSFKMTPSLEGYFSDDRIIEDGFEVISPIRDVLGHLYLLDNAFNFKLSFKNDYAVTHNMNLLINLIKVCNTINSGDLSLDELEKKFIEKKGILTQLKLEAPNNRNLYCMTPIIIKTIKEFLKNQKEQIDFQILESMIKPDLSRKLEDVIDDKHVFQYLGADE